MRKLTIFLSLALALAVSVSCEKEQKTAGSGTQFVSGVSLDLAELKLYPSATASLTAKVLPEGAVNQNVTWSCSDNSVLKVEGDGLKANITALDKLGNAKVTVTTEDGGYTAECNVTVANFKYRVQLSIPAENLQHAPYLMKDETATIVVAMHPQQDRACTWKSSDESVATVEALGLWGSVTGKKAGVTYITAEVKDEGEGTYCVPLRVEVIDGWVQPTKVDFDLKEAYIQGNAYQHTINFTPSNTNDKSATVTSSNSSVVRITKQPTVDNPTFTVSISGTGSADITVSTPGGAKVTKTIAVASVTITSKNDTSTGLVNDGAIRLRCGDSYSVRADAKNLPSTEIKYYFVYHIPKSSSTPAQSGEFEIPSESTILQMSLNSGDKSDWFEFSDKNTLKACNYGGYYSTPGATEAEMYIEARSAAYPQVKDAIPVTDIWPTAGTLKPDVYTVKIGSSASVPISYYPTGYGSAGNACETFRLPRENFRITGFTIRDKSSKTVSFTNIGIEPRNNRLVLDLSSVPSSYSGYRITFKWEFTQTTYYRTDTYSDGFTITFQ